MDETYLGYRVLLLMLIIGFNAFFASAELSLISARPSRLRELAAAGNVGAQAALNLLGRPERLLATVQVGVTLAGIGVGWAGEDTLYRVLMLALQPLATPRIDPLLHAISFVIAFLLLTFSMVVFGEVVPKNLGIKQAERYAVVAAPLLLIFYRVSAPFIYVLERASAAVSRVLGLGAEAVGRTHSVEELKLIASSVRVAGRIAAFEESALHRLVDLQNVSVREIMVPRNDIVSVSIEASLDHVLRTLLQNQYTRVPVYQHKPEEIVGILHYKDLLPLWQRMQLAARMNAPVPPFQIRALLRRHLVVPAEPRAHGAGGGRVRHHRRPGDARRRAGTGLRRDRRRTRRAPAEALADKPRGRDRGHGDYPRPGDAVRDRGAQQRRFRDAGGFPAVPAGQRSQAGRCSGVGGAAVHHSRDGP
jgi:putative hemolysin